MKKIRRLKLTSHYKEISRRIVKAGIKLGENNDAAPSIEDLVNSLARAAESSVVYSTFDKETSNRRLFDTFTIGALTLGKAVSVEIDSLTQEDFKKAGEICAFEFLDTAFDLVLGLIKEEALKENFELGIPQLIYFPQPKPEYSARFLKKSSVLEDDEERKKQLSSLSEKLDISKISVLVSDNKVTPYYTIFFTIQWLRKKRRKK